ncbi:aldose 1-epimerase [Bacillus sp. M6-12]|uniref:aldose 1-epimerase n=1 Tax=Bacillus sp. M6-12 TaxID=2054166 RepID=UPI000C7907E7|nr:aldose 1-epimerase [Bacillus sp. M6-12]PLS18506.1 aldose 1-epimerase [Bacillus sp. M6-12]
MAIQNIRFLNKPAIEMENDYLKIILLPDQGSNLISVYDKIKDFELLRIPKNMEEFNSANVLYGTPVLFPPNRIDGASFEFHNRTYQFEMNRPEDHTHIHGLVHDKKWNVTKLDNKNNVIVTEFIAKNHSEVIRQFPHDFTIEMTIQLTGNKIIQTLTIINNSSTTMPVGTGFHTTFHFPAKDSLLFMDVDEYWELNDRNMPTGRMLKVPYKKQLKDGMNLGGLSLDEIYPIKNNYPAIIEHRDPGIKIKYKAEKGYQHWVVFTMEGKNNLLALEPYSWVTNAPNLSLPDKVIGLCSLKPKEEKVFTTSLLVEHT